MLFRVWCIVASLVVLLHVEAAPVLFENKVEFDTAVNAEAIKFEGSAGTNFGMLDATWLGIMNNVQISTITTMRYDLVIDGTDRLAFTQIRSFSVPEPFLALLMSVGLFGLFIRMQGAVVNSDYRIKCIHVK